MGGQFAALTYLTPFPAKLTHTSGGVISLFLFAYGIANAAGTFAGGWAADRNASRTLITANIVLAVATGGLYLGGAHPAAAAIALLIWGLVGFGLVPSLKYRVISRAGPGSGRHAARLDGHRRNRGRRARPAAGRCRPADRPPRS